MPNMQKKYPVVTVFHDMPTWTMKIGIETSKGKVYQHSFAMDIWESIDAESKYHMIKMAFDKAAYSDAEVYKALLFIKQEILFATKHFQNEFLMKNSIFNQEKSFSNSFDDYYVQDWKVDKENPHAEILVKKNPINGTSLGPWKELEVLPALLEKVKHPISSKQEILRHVIINLNDQYKWTREQIADWLETLDVDIRFQPKEVTNEQD